MAFLNDIEAAQLLKIPVIEMNRLGIHKCPNGYSEEILQEFCSLHGLPIGDWHNVVGFSTKQDIEVEGVEVYNTWEEVLFAANVKTKALLSDNGIPPEFVVSLSQKNGIKVLLISEEKIEGFFTTNSWQDAARVARNV